MQPFQISWVRIKWATKAAIANAEVKTSANQTAFEEDIKEVEVACHLWPGAAAAQLCYATG